MTNPSSSQTDYQENIGLVHRVARKVFSRVQDAHLPLSYEDVFQDVSVSWVLAARSFNEDSGVSFSTYFFKAAYRNLNRTLEKTGHQFIDLGLVGFSDLTNGESEGAEWCAPDISSMPEWEVIENEDIESRYMSMSNEARSALVLLLDPPAIVIREMEIARTMAREKVASGEKKVPRAFGDRVAFVVSIVAKVIGLEYAKERKVRSEVKNFVNQVMAA